jgi:hypothetical protein
MAVTLGGFAFANLEIPEEMPFSGSKHLMMHHLIGGDRVFDDMGDNPDPIEWTGVFLGGSASARARQLDAMKQEGGQYLLTWGSFARQVVIRHFKARYHYEYRVSYSICVEVVPTQAAGIPSIADLIAGDFATLAGMVLDPASAALVSTAQIAVSGAAAAAATGQFVDAPLPALLNASATVQAAANGLFGAMDAADVAQPELDLTALSGLSPTDASATLLNLVNTSAAVADTAAAAGYLGRIAGNVALYGG